MTGSLRQYLNECFSAAPTSWRRGAVITTLLVHAVMLGGLYLGWHFDAYPISYVLMGTFLVAALDLLLIFPFKLWEANKAEIASLTDRLTSKLKIMDFNTDHRECDDGLIRICTICIFNDGPDLISHCLVKLEDVNGHPPASLTTRSD